MASEKFNGLSDVEDFIIQYKIVSQVKKYKEEQNKFAVAAYLSGPALQFYKANFNSFTSLDDFFEKLKKEFPPRINYAQAFYYRTQTSQESPLDYYYALDALAMKATGIDESAFVDHYRKNLAERYKIFFATTQLKTKEELRNAIWQYVDIFENDKTPQLNIPLSEPINTSMPEQNIIPQLFQSFASSQETVMPGTSATPVSSGNTPILQPVTPVAASSPVGNVNVGPDPNVTPVRSTQPRYDFRERPPQYQRQYYNGRGQPHQYGYRPSPRRGISSQQHGTYEDSPNYNQRRGGGAPRR